MPHAGQRHVMRHARRFNWLSAGRRWRKTTLAMSIVVEAAARGGTYIWGAPTYEQSRIGFDETRHALGVLGVPNQSRMSIVVPFTGGQILYRSLDKPDNARGQTADGVVIDEAGFVNPMSWTAVLRPMLIDTGGWAWGIGTPAGRNWFYTEFQKAVDHDDYMAWQIPTRGVRVEDGQLVPAPHPLENPDIPFSEIVQLWQTLPERVFRQEILAEFLAETGENTFRREWWTEHNRYAAGALDVAGRVLGYYQSWDTAEETGDENAWTVGVTFALLRDYRVAVVHVYRQRMTFDALPGVIEAQARMFAENGLLRAVVIEDKSSGKSARYTLQASAAGWLRELIIPFKPQGSKEARASAASVWCRNGMVMLPQPGPDWLLDFEDELFAFPQSRYADQVDAFGQGIIYLENYLAEGYRARGGGRV